MRDQKKVFTDLAKQQLANEIKLTRTHTHTHTRTRTHTHAHTNTHTQTHTHTHTHTHAHTNTHTHTILLSYQLKVDNNLEGEKKKMALVKSVTMLFESACLAVPCLASLKCNCNLHQFADSEDEFFTRT